MQPRAKNLILDLLSTVGRSAVPVRSLVAAGRLFGLADNGVRVALARLLADGIVDRDERGLYHLGPGARAVNARIRSWRHLDELMQPWSGDWIGVQTAGLARGSARTQRRRERALRLLGFRPFARGLELRPDNLAAGVEGLRAQLVDLGLDAAALVCRVSALVPDDDRRARKLWDADALRAGYAASREQLRASAEALAEQPRGEAMVESFVTGGEAIRRLVLDPLLPEPIVPAAERRALVDAVLRYDRLGRTLWAGWSGAGTTDQFPADIRGLEAAGDLLRAAEGA